MFLKPEKHYFYISPANCQTFFRLSFYNKTNEKLKLLSFFYYIVLLLNIFSRLRLKNWDVNWYLFWDFVTFRKIHFLWNHVSVRLTGILLTIAKPFKLNESVVAITNTSCVYLLTCVWVLCFLKMQKFNLSPTLTLCYTKAT